MQLLPPISHLQRTAAPPEKYGYLELKGYKAKIFTLLQGSHAWICKSEQVDYFSLTVSVHRMAMLCNIYGALHYERSLKCNVTMGFMQKLCL